jgi:hypothetical protein
MKRVWMELDWLAAAVEAAKELSVGKRDEERRLGFHYNRDLLNYIIKHNLRTIRGATPQNTINSYLNRVIIMNII